jgi:MFS family permease
LNVRALILVCLYAATTATNYTNHGPVIDVIAAEFELDAASAGAIATAFFAGSAAMMLAGGWLADRVGTRRMISLGFGIVVISNLACGLASPTYLILLGWRFVGGMGTGLAFAAGAAYINAVFGPRGAHLAQGLYGASFLAGSASSLLFMPALAGPADDWRLAYTLSGLGVGIAWLAWTIGAPAEPRARARLAGRTAAGLGAALAARNSWLLGLCHMCGFGLAMILGTWVTS